MKKIWIGVAAVVVLVGGFYVWQASSSDGVAYTSPVAATGPLPDAGPPPAPKFKDTSMLKPPAGAEVAIYEFDDLECPACAHTLPILQAAAARYRIPIVHHDFPLTEIHVWSFDAAVTARYLQDKVSPEIADNFRREVFANQSSIVNKDDLDRFTKQWFAANHLTVPFAIDADGDCSRQVKADRALGDRLGVPSTPCVFVVTRKSWTYVANVQNLSQTIDAALASTAGDAGAGGA